MHGYPSYKMEHKGRATLLLFGPDQTHACLCSVCRIKVPVFNNSCSERQLKVIIPGTFSWRSMVKRFSGFNGRRNFTAVNPFIRESGIHLCSAVITSSNNTTPGTTGLPGKWPSKLGCVEGILCSLEKLNDCSSSYRVFQVMLYGVAYLFHCVAVCQAG